MSSFEEMEIYEDDSFEKEITDSNFEFYFDELKSVRKRACGCVVAWIVPDTECGHVEYRNFDTWTAAEDWKRQR